MTRSNTALAALLLGIAAPLVFAAGGIPVVDRTDRSPSAPAAPALGPVVNPVVSPMAVSDSSRAAVASLPKAAVSANAELFMMLDQLQEEVRFLRGQVEEQQHQLQRLQVDQRDRYRDLDRRLGLLSQRAVAVPMAPTAALPAALPSPLSASASVPADRPAVMAPAAATVADAQAYKDAFSLVRERNFDQALRAFEGFLQQYPDSSLTANVLYWTAEVHRAKPTPDQQKASLAYQQLLTRYPGHPKAADAYYKLGLSYYEQGLLDKGKASMAKVIELFPDQAPANLAEDFLQRNR